MLIEQMNIKWPKLLASNCAAVSLNNLDRNVIILGELEKPGRSIHREQYLPAMTGTER